MKVAFSNSKYQLPKSAFNLGFKQLLRASATVPLKIIFEVVRQTGTHSGYISTANSLYNKTVTIEVLSIGSSGLFIIKFDS